MSCQTCTNSRPDAADIRRARAVICHWCLWCEHSTDGPWTGVGVACTISGRPVEEHIAACRPNCPKGKHPDASTGMVRFLGIQWYGAPAVFRWMLRGRLKGPVPGCGCMKWAKDRWVRIKHRFVAWATM